MEGFTEQQIEELKTLARLSTTVEDCGEDWNPYEISGGNYDDAYWTGRKDAEIEYARCILSILNIEY